MSTSRLLLVAAVAAVAAGCGSSAPKADYRGSIPPASIRAPDFTLRSYRGPLVRRAALRGKVVLVTFIDSKCTESCPLIAGIVAIALRRMSATERSQIKALAITVQPHFDTKASVRRFLESRHALPYLDYLIGSVRELRPVWHAYHVLPAIDTGSPDIHSASVRIYDRAGIWVSNLHTGVDLTPINLAHDLRTALAA